jgi:hypothetical protein
MNIQVALTDAQKLTAEHFNSKIRSLGHSLFFIAATRGFNLDQWVEYDFVTSLALWDALVYAWSKKVKFDLVRPVTAIKKLYGDTTISGWGGPGKGVVSLKGREWSSYLYTMPHSEYPSGSTCFCAAFAQVSRRYLGSDAYGYFVDFPVGSSIIEPGVTPSQPVHLEWATWTDLVNECGKSRKYAGVHFESSIANAKGPCTIVGDRAYNRFLTFLNGTNPGPVNPADRDPVSSIRIPSDDDDEQLAQSPSTPESSSAQSKEWIIIGSALGGLVFVVGTSLLFYLMCRKSRKNTLDDESRRNSVSVRNIDSSNVAAAPQPQPQP